MIILKIFIIIVLCCFTKHSTAVKYKKISKYKSNSFIKRFPEFKKIESQQLWMVSPSEQCHCHQKTIFFRYPSFLEQDDHAFNVTELTIREKEYFVGALQQFEKSLKSKKTFRCLDDALQKNNIIRLYHSDDPNLYWKNTNEKKTKINFNYYQRYSNTLKYSEITRKDLLYKNYVKMKNQFPGEFNYIPETYTDETMDQFKEKNKGYKVSKDNLWLVKPKGLSRGRNIFVLREIEDIKRNDIVTKYISNPLLIHHRKFDLRLYLLVTGHDPLKAYLFREGLVRLSSDPFDLDLEDLDNLFKHLTNTSINKNNTKGYSYDDLVLSIEYARDYLEKTYHVDFSVIWEQIKDMSVKTLLSMNHVELAEEKKFKLASTNLFKIYGVDIMIDSNFKPWLIEFNHLPDFGIYKSKRDAKKTKYQLMYDIFNIIGLIPYSHIDGHALEGECTYENSVMEAVDQSICEFTRPLGGFERIFPVRETLPTYKKYFKKITSNNQALWEKIQKGEKGNTPTTPSETQPNSDSKPMEIKKVIGKSEDSKKDGNLHSSTLPQKEENMKVNSSILLQSENNINSSMVPPKENDLNESTVSEKENNINSSIVPPKENDLNESTVSEKENNINSSMVPPKENDLNESTVSEKENNINSSIVPPKENKMSQFKNIKSQKLLMMSPSPQCKIPQRTVYFRYPSFMEDNMNDKTSKLVITKKEYFVGSVQYFGKNITSKYSPVGLKRTLKDNGIFRVFVEGDVNLYWRSTRNNSVIPPRLNKYQRYNHMLMFHEITRKHLLYKNYKIFRNLFPNDYNYLPETYTNESLDEFKEKFNDYTVSKDNLWLIKPRNASYGKGIHFLRNASDVKENEIVTRYISDPLLINGRKFDLRFHVLVTGHNPLKVYIHSDGWAKVSSEYYDLDLNNLTNLYKHVTNLGLNMKNKGKFNPEEFILSLAKVKKYLQKTYNLNFSEVMEEVKDLVIKSLITMNHMELEKEKEYGVSSNNIFDLYGIDVIIDRKFKPWLVEININPSLGEEGLTLDRKKMLRQTLNDVFNVIGIVPYSRRTGTALEGEIEFRDSVDEAVQQTLCEFTRPLGGFERIFPLKSNINYYRTFFKEISPNNQALWDELQNKTDSGE
ncbi:hypothetical protein PIROE2DRAFT_56863 [Piromyces sp. E2]|nr:hypothetical protein PIROE2DRAFT_56863 [Piromyces sp. E2]|eukprot:OUM70388.1 hypothetical protein PIROE2DRAFT_56863 [Piromyces sp. E2]